MIRTINGKRYLMRDLRPVKELRSLYKQFIIKFHSKLTFEQWLASQGKVHLKLPASKEK